MRDDIEKSEQDTDQFEDVAVIIPCLNEDQSIAAVIEGFRKYVPGAKIYVCDNASTDNTAAVAKAAGAFVTHENKKGKANAMRRLFRDVDAEIYVMVDGDLTYDISTAPDFVRRLRNEGRDLIVGTRVTEDGQAYRLGHRLGNIMLSKTVAWLFRQRLGDMLSGYRVMSRRFVKTFPVATTGFEIETEMTIHAFQVEASYLEIPVTYYSRIEGTESKLKTWQDGYWILRTICDLVILERPVAVFGGLGAALIMLSLILFWPILIAFQETGLVERFPTLVACATLGLTGLISLFSSVILSALSRSRRDMKRLGFLSYSGPSKH